MQTFNIDPTFAAEAGLDLTSSVTLKAGIYGTGQADKLSTKLSD
jgi:hypothetical protein